MNEAPRRPPMVWLITVLYFVSAVWALLSLLLAYSGKVKLPPAQARFLQQQSDFDILMTVVMGALNLTGVVYLFRMRRPALAFFATTFILGIGMSIYHVLAQGWLEGREPAALGGVVLGALLNAGVLAYCWWLRSTGALR